MKFSSNQQGRMTLIPIRRCHYSFQGSFFSSALISFMTQDSRREKLIYLIEILLCLVTKHFHKRLLNIIYIKLNHEKSNFIFNFNHLIFCFVF